MQVWFKVLRSSNQKELPLLLVCAKTCNNSGPEDTILQCDNDKKNNTRSSITSKNIFKRKRKSNIKRNNLSRKVAAISQELQFTLLLKTNLASKKRNVGSNFEHQASKNA